MRSNLLALAILCATVPAVAIAAPEFVNGIALDGAALDLSGGSDGNTGRIGYFSDIHYDAKRKHWWGLSDRGPGGGTLDYETRVQRFRLDIDPYTGAIGGFHVLQTLILRDEFGYPMNGLAPNPTDALVRALDPEGFVVDPVNGHFLVSDEYGPSLYEFDREGYRVRVFQTPENLVPRNAVSSVPNYAGDSGNTAGKRTNRGFEGLAISADGAYVYAMLQSAMLDEGGSNGRCVRIVKFDMDSGTAVAQYAYQMEGSSQGRGTSALVALNDTQFLVLERNNRGLGVDATLASPNKRVYRVDIADADDVSDVAFAPGACPTGAVAKSGPFLDLAANTLEALGGKVPEKWEGLAVGPLLRDGSRLLLAGTDNDYSVTQNDSGTQFDVYFRFTDTDPYAGSIQCPLDETTGCFYTTGGAPVLLPEDGSYRLVPGVLHAYRVTAADLGDYVPPVPPAAKR